MAKILFGVKPEQQPHDAVPVHTPSLFHGKVPMCLVLQTFVVSTSHVQGGSGTKCGMVRRLWNAFSKGQVLSDT